MNTVIIIMEAAALACMLSLDAFVASFAYGSNRIKIPFSSVQIINIICAATLGLSLLAGSFIQQYIPPALTTAICFTILFILGIMKLLDYLTKSIIRNHSGISREIKFSMLNFRFILSLYADPERADVDASKVISPAEAASLAVALSLDGIAVGFAAAFGNVNGPAVVISALVMGMLAVLLGCRLGNKLARSLKFNLSWVSGVFLIALAFLKLL